ncbi:MAG: hypothetical protein QXN21_04845, partial [Candidatus Bathyarchaeia archaeon]
MGPGFPYSPYVEGHGDTWTKDNLYPEPVGQRKFLEHLNFGKTILKSIGPKGWKEYKTLPISPILSSNLRLP